MDFLRGPDEFPHDKLEFRRLCLRLSRETAKLIPKKRRKLHVDMEKIERASLHADRTYDLSGKSMPWNDVSLLFSVHCNLLLLGPPPRSCDYGDPNLAGLHLRGQRVEFMAQSDFLDAVHLLCMRWPIVKSSKALWSHVAALEHRGAELCQYAWSSSVLNECATKNDDDEGSFRCTDDFVSHLASVFSSMRLSRYVLFDVISRVESMGACKKAPPGFVAWCDSEEARYNNDNFKTILDTVDELCLRPGEQDNYARTFSGVISDDPQVIARFNRPMESFPETIEAKRKTMFPWEHSIARLKLFDLRCRREKFPWWTYAMVLDRDYLRVKMKLFDFEEPVILRIAGTFYVLRNDESNGGVLLEAEDAESAIYTWCDIVSPVYRSRGKSWDLGYLKKAMRIWNGEKEEAPRDVQIIKF